MKSEGVKKLLEDLVVKKHVPCFTVHVKATSFLATWKRRIHSIYGVVIIKIKRTNVIAHEVCYFADAGCPTKVFHQIQSLPLGRTPSSQWGASWQTIPAIQSPYSDAVSNLPTEKWRLFQLTKGFSFGRKDLPWKINMEPTKHPFRKENDLPNFHDSDPC